MAAKSKKHVSSLMILLMLLACVALARLVHYNSSNSRSENVAGMTQHENHRDVVRTTNAKVEAKALVRCHGGGSNRHPSPKQKRRRRKRNRHNNDEIIIDDDARSSNDSMVTVEQFQKTKECSHDFKDSVTFFHVGKAGGGTITNELRRRYRIGVASTHPKPNPSRIREFQIPGRSQTLIVNVRDPVDRFVSAFRWRVVVLCHPDDERDGHKKGAAQRPEDMCKNSPSDLAEERMLRERYRSDPSVLGEAMCGGEDAAVRERAVEDYSSIGHSMMLVEWLRFLIEPTLVEKISEDGIQNVVALPLERLQDGTTLFEQHIRQVSLHLLQSRYDEQTAHAILDKKAKEDGNTTKGKEKMEHSSVRFFNSTTTTSGGGTSSSSELSPLAECCLARHLKEDYRLIQTMLLGKEGDNNDDYGEIIQPLRGYHPSIRNACFWGNEEQQELCRSDLRSMILRRAKFLDLSMGTCPEIIDTPNR